MFQLNNDNFYGKYSLGLLRNKLENNIPMSRCSVLLGKFVIDCILRMFWNSDMITAAVFYSKLLQELLDCFINDRLQNHSWFRISISMRILI